MSEKFSEDQYKNGNTAVDLNTAESKVEIAINEVEKAIGSPSGAAPSSAGDDMISEVAMTKVAGVIGPALTGASMFMNEMASSMSSLSGKGKKSASMFMDSKGNPVEEKPGSRPRNAMGMDMSYSEAKAAGKKDPKKTGKHAGVVSRAHLASESLTGESGAHKHPCGTKGTQVSSKDAAKLAVPQDLKDALTSIRKAKEEPSLSNLAQGLARGDNNAEHFMATNPHNMVVQNMHRRLEMTGGNHSSKSSSGDNS